MTNKEKEFEQKISESLRGEYLMNEEQKEKSWNEIMSRVDISPKKKKSYWKLAVPLVAACAIFAFGLSTQSGLALVDQIKQLFVPEKDVKIEIEGTEEEGKAILEESKNRDFVIYIDEERYRMIKNNDESVITTKEPLPERYPEVFMKIIHKESTVEETVSSLEEEIGVAFEETDTPIKAMKGKVLEGQDWNSKVHKYYVISDQLEGSYVIHQQYFLEASEGHGVRLDAMLKEFHIVQ